MLASSKRWLKVSMLIMVCGMACSKKITEGRSGSQGGKSFSNSEVNVSDSEATDEDACSPQPITGSNLSTNQAKCEDRPLDEGEGIGGYITDPTAFSVESNSHDESTSIKNSIIKGKEGSVVAASNLAGEDVTKVLVIAFQVDESQLQSIVSKNGEEIIVKTTRFNARYAKSNGGFTIKSSIELGKPLIIAVAKKLAKDGTITLAPSLKQFVYVSKAKVGGEFLWPAPNGQQLKADGSSSIVAGNSGSCVVLNGGVKCWGWNDFGILGDETEVSKTGIVQDVVTLGNGVSMVAVGPDSHACAIQHGSVKCWGRSQDVRYGSTVNSFTSVPTAVANLSSNVTAISVGMNYTCGVRLGAAWCSGSANDAGQLGSNAVDGLESNVVAVSSGYSHHCAIVGDAAKCWGENNRGQLGIGFGSYGSTSPMALQVVGMESGVTAISASRYSPFTCAIKLGVVYCWGDDRYGQVKVPTDPNEFSPNAYRVDSLTQGATEIATGEHHACAIVGDSAMCWGEYSAALGIGEGVTERFVSPTKVINPPGKTKVSSITAGKNHTCALFDGQPYCWGRRASGELGNGVGATDSFVPIAVAVP